MLVSMRLSEKFAVPEELALLYDFVNTLDRRFFVEQGIAHAGGDALATPQLLEAWMRRHRLLRPGARIVAEEHEKALALRGALRSFLEHAPADRHDTGATRALTAASRDFPLMVIAARDGRVGLEPAPGASALGRILAELYRLGETDRLARLKACASEECRWIFFDRSKPANRHWCSSALCGNRQKTRTYRRRRAAGE
jgi:predicted RNA-binding Zn ribbon-like protein